jgi:Ca-activated chloride channel family protein
VRAAFALALLLALAAPAAAADERSVLLVVDASKSMNASAGGGLTRLDAAKRAVSDLLGTIPEGAAVGLRVYGARVAGAGRSAASRDTRLVVPVGPLDRAAMRARVDALRGRGRTPIGRSLLAAPGDLPAGGRRTVILVSDGGDDCAPPDPCRAARTVSHQGVDLTIQVVGLQVNERVRRQLSCIARAGGGTYVDAGDPHQLGAELRAAFARALRTYRPAGTPIQGGPDPGAPAAAGPGQYLDTIGPGEDRWYAIDVPAGSRLAVAATAVPGPGLRGQTDFELQVLGGDGRSVDVNSQLVAGRNDENGRVRSVAITTLPAGGAGPAPGSFRLRVSAKDASFTGRLPVELGLDVLRPGEPPDFRAPAGAHAGPAPARRDAQVITRRRTDGAAVAALAIGGLAVGGGLGFGAVRRRRR